MSFFKKIFFGEKYDFIDYKSLRKTVTEVNAYTTSGMACFVYFNSLNGKTFTVEVPAGSFTGYNFSDKHLFLVGKYTRQNPVPNVCTLADSISFLVGGFYEKKGL